MSDEWYTPASIFTALGTTFDVDVCAPHNGSLNTPCRKWFCVCCTDGLSASWEGLVFMNPPYSNPKPWIQKWLEHGDGIALLPFAKSRWFNELMERQEAPYVVLPSNFKFVTAEYRQVRLMMLSGLWATGQRAEELLRNAGLGKLHRIEA